MADIIATGVWAMRFSHQRVSDERGPVPGSAEDRISRVVRAIADLFRPQPSLRIP